MLSIFYIDIILKQNEYKIRCEKSKMVSFASWILKMIALFPSGSRLPVNLIWCIAFGSASST